MKNNETGKTAPPGAAQKMQQLVEARSTEIILFAAILMVGFPTLFLPFGRDQAALSYVGRNLLDGGLPYLSYWDHKGPLLPFIYSIVSWGEIGYFKLRLLDLLNVGAICYMMVLGLRRLFPGRSFILYSLIYSLSYFTISFWHTAQGESFQNLFIVGAFFIGTGSRKGRLFLIGLLLGVAAAIKPTTIFHLTAVLVVVSLFERKKFFARVSAAFELGLGFAVMPTIFILIYSIAGGVDEMYSALVRFNLMQGKSSYMLIALGAMANVVYIILFPAAFAVIGAISGREDGDRRARAWLLSFTVASLAAVVAQRRLWLYHWVIFTPWLSAYAAGGAAASGRAIFGRGKPVHERLGAAALIVLALAVFGERWWATSGFKPLLTARTESDYYSSFVSKQESYDLGRSMRIADYIKSKTAPDEKILLFGFESNAYQLADRRHATRFLNDLPLTFEAVGPEALELKYRWRSEFIDNLKADPPKLIGLAADDTNTVESVESSKQAEMFIDFMVFLRINYREPTRVENIIFYLRDDSARPGSGEKAD